MKRALFVGRFQPFHLGHFNAVKWILKSFDELIIGIGSSQYSHTKENPFTVGERIEMIWEQIREDNLTSKVIIVPIPDIGEHKLWVSVVKQYCPKFDVVFSNSPLTRILFIEEGYEVQNIPYFNREIYDGTKIREKIANDDDWEKYLPNKIAEYIKRNKLNERLKYIYKHTDKVI